MRLSDAIEVNHSSEQRGKPARVVQLACGFTPLHLQTFLQAHIQLRSPDREVRVETGAFGDLIGPIDKARQQHSDSCAVVIEWPDLDLRLGYRGSGGWKASSMDDIFAEVRRKLETLATEILKTADQCPVAVSAPTLPLVPISYTTPDNASSFELKVWTEMSAFLSSLANHGGVRVMSQQRLAEVSPPGLRFDIKFDLLAGFPYRQAHADKLAELYAAVLYPKTPKKGLITDLDQTLWSGILGEDGVEGVTWNLEGHSQLHGLYQQLLAALAESGVLIAIASKNDPQLVAKALSRPDCLIPASCIYPADVHWGAKSESVARILTAWNVGADSVVMIDDSPLELSEVQAKFPEVECLLFDSKNAEATLQLFWKVRELFGRPVWTDEDRARTSSLRTAELFQPPVGTQTSSEFLSTVGSKITIDFRPNSDDRRALELVNKTNQFNLNGRRFSEAEWKQAMSQPCTFFALISYEDKFGSLGRIAVVVGEAASGRATVRTWVMSCRAFGRHIEYQTVRRLFDHLKVQEIRLCYSPTERNGPLREFLAAIGCLGTGSEVVVTENIFRQHCPLLFHDVKEVTGG